MRAMFLAAIGILLVLSGSVMASSNSLRPHELMIAQANTQSQTLCPQNIVPVCAIKDGKATTYNNDCEARRAGATEIKPGRCDEQK
jgi:hypothetical protein